MSAKRSKCCAVEEGVLFRLSDEEISDSVSESTLRLTEVLHRAQGVFVSSSLPGEGGSGNRMVFVSKRHPTKIGHTFLDDNVDRRITLETTEKQRC